ncbi:MAG: TRAP transporter small permease subunit [Ignavibacteriae bacterium]|nr:TRAP transporter small permease subunit [Ignavibacteriota bacterium]
MKLIQTLSTALAFIERTLVVLLLGVMVLLAFSQVILRNVFSTGFLWADPLLRHMVLWVGFVGASLATQQEKHISIDLITRFVSPKIKTASRIMTNLLAGIVCAFLANAAWTFLLSEMESGDVLFTIGKTSFPLWWFEAIIPFGFAFIAFRFLLRVVEHVMVMSRTTFQP